MRSESKWVESQWVENNSNFLISLNLTTDARAQWLSQNSFNNVILLFVCYLKEPR